jgi:hypothetical protein
VIFCICVVVRTTAATTAPPTQARKFTTTAPTAGEGEDGSGLKAEGSEQFERDHRSYQRSRQGQGEYIFTVEFLLLYTRPRATRTCLFRLINIQNRTKKKYSLRCYTYMAKRLFSSVYYKGLDKFSQLFHLCLVSS